MGVRVTGNVGGFGGLGAAIEAEIKGLRQDVGTEVKKLAQDGEDMMKEFIETRGTAKSGKRGRIETGEMRDAVANRVLEDTDQATRAEYGWIDDSPGHRTYQELGTKFIEPMFALRDSQEATTEEFQAFLKSRSR